MVAKHFIEQLNKVMTNMRRIFLLGVCLLTVLTAGAWSMDEEPGLHVDTMGVEGPMMGGLTHLVEFNLRNNSDEDFEGHIYLLARDRVTGVQTVCADTLYQVQAGNLWDGLSLLCQLPEGDLCFFVATDREGEKTLGCMLNLIVGPLTRLALGASFVMDMMDSSSDENVLYGSRMRGRVNVYASDNRWIRYHVYAGGKGEDDGIVLWIEESESGEHVYTQHLSDKMEGGGITIVRYFAFDTSFRDGAVYALKVGYGTPHGLEPIDSLVFTMRQGAYTYWTADGQVLPLPEEGQGVCKVPAEAVAVDLRGRQVQGITAAVDVVEANPNCLYYMDSDDVLPEGMTADLNVIRGLQAECVQVSDEYDYYCPLAFKADYISYLLKPSYDDPWAEEHHLGYSQTLVLPFYVSDVLLYDVNGKNASLHEDELVVFQYFGCDADTLQISRLGSVKWMQAYTPYILGVYVGSRLLFIGEDTQVPMTREAITRGQDYDFVGTTVRRHIDHAYLYSARDDCFVLDWAGLGVEPFRAAICMGQGDPSAGVPDHLSFDSCIWGDRGRPGAVSEPADHDGIGEQSCDCVARRLPVCTLSGQHVATADCADGSLHGLGLRPGVYVTGTERYW